MASTGLNEREIRIAAYVEQCWYEHGKLPSNEFVAEKLGVSKVLVANAWKNDSFRSALKARGLNLDNKSDASVLLPKQVMLAQLLLNSHDKKSVREKLELLDITSQQYHAWMRQPAFTGYLRNLAEKHFAGSDAIAYMALIGNVEKGDPASIKLFFEMRSIYNPKLDVNINIDGLFARITEILVKYVDPALLPAIANELEGLRDGNSPVQMALPEYIPDAEVVEEQPINLASLFGG